MVKVNVIYTGEKRCELAHVSSGAKILTDAPKDNFGKGESFSPTDLVGSALASCMLTTIAIFAEKENWAVSLKGSSAETEKIMSSHPRRIETLEIQLFLPKSLDTQLKSRAEEIAKSCPVMLSLHPNLKVNLRFHYTTL